MPKINLIVIGSIKEKYWQSAIAEYTKRLAAFCTLEIVELKEESFAPNDDLDRVKKREAEKILTNIAKRQKTNVQSVVYVLDENGVQFSSETFAQKMDEIANRGETIFFVIGGALGLDPSVLNMAHKTLSLSKMTFTHQMARVILLEQIYRAQMIGHGRKYHY